jgi:SAM-dependent methyltransferase
VGFLKMEIKYSDGVDIEAGILQLVEGATDRSSFSAIGKDQYWDWPVRYHLSPERANLFRHMDLSGLDILELGAGMGGVSRYLAEQAKTFVAVEGTQTRFNILSKRLEDLSNWTGVVSNIEDFKTDQKFDVVCMVGVLEYAELYIDPLPGESPFTSLLAHAASFLKPGGVFFLAIENKYGIKYWAGAPEDHTGQMFDGICGYSMEKTPQTFSRKRLLNFLKTVGINEVEEYYPWPDYKLPQAVISRALVDQFPEIAADIAADSMTRDPNPSLEFFPTSLAARQAIYSGLISDISNSFLLVGSPDPESETLKHVLGKSLGEKEVAWHYSFSRSQPISTTFKLDAGENRPVVSKQTLREAVSRQVGQYVRWKEVPPAPVLLGPKVSHLLKRAAYYQGREAYEDMLVNFLKETFEQFKLDSGQLKPEAYDAVPQNAVWAEPGQYDYFDLEWVLTAPMSKEWLVLRTVLCEIPSAKVLPSGAYGSLEDLFRSLCTKLDLDADPHKVTQREAEVQAEIGTGLSIEALPAYYRKLLREPMRSDMFPRDPSVEGYLRQSVTDENLGAKLHKLENEVNSLKSLLNRRSVRLALSMTSKLKRLKVWSFSAANILILDAINLLI